MCQPNVQPDGVPVSLTKYGTYKLIHYTQFTDSNSIYWYIFPLAVAFHVNQPSRGTGVFDCDL